MKKLLTTFLSSFESLWLLFVLLNKVLAMFRLVSFRSLIDTVFRWAFRPFKMGVPILLVTGLRNLTRPSCNCWLFNCRIYGIIPLNRTNFELIIFPQSISLGIFRSDYLIDKSHNDFADLCLKQVELNTISISAITSSCRTTNLHR